MYAGTLSYFAQLQAQHQLSALASKVKTGLIASKGIFGYEPKITYLFGLPRTISSGGIHLDIESTHALRSLDNDQKHTIDTAIQIGPIGSALEHQVPEQMFNTDPANPTQAISTVKALQLANQQGQQIYKIDQTNIDTVLPKLNLSNTIKQDIQSSVNAGKYVITHTDNVSVPGWSGAGYAIIDPTTGSDAYFISGGENGAFLLIMSLLMSSLGGMFDSYSEAYSEKQPYLNYKRAQIAKVLGTCGRWLGILGVLMTAITVAMDDTLSTADKIGQIIASIVGALMSSAFITLAAPLLTGPGLILLGTFAATALALGLAAVSMEYFSRRTVLRRYYAV